MSLVEAFESDAFGSWVWLMEYFQSSNAKAPATLDFTRRLDRHQVHATIPYTTCGQRDDYQDTRITCVVEL